jgi:hypothetical protein
LLDHDGELRVALAALADVARVDAVLREGLRALGIGREQLVAVEMKIADQRHGAASGIELVADRGNGRSGFRRIHRDAHEFGTCSREGADLRDGGRDVGRVGIRHRLHDDRCAATDANATDAGVARPVTHDRGCCRRVHCRVSRAMFLRVYGARSIAWPR